MRMAGVEPTYHFVPFRGGLDMVTPPIEVPIGFLRESQNFEVGVNGGYDTIQGYERFDGRPKPSLAQYAILPVTITGTISAGDVITGASSAETAVVIAVSDEYLVITSYSGEFDSGEVINVMAAPVATTTDVSIPGAAETQELDCDYTYLASQKYRSEIDKVPGSGNVLGIFRIGDDIYAVRNTEDETAAVMHKQSISGWVAVNLGSEMAFTSGGTYEIAIGNTITGATSAATAIVKNVVLTSGTWATGDAAGRLILSGKTGTFASESIKVGANADVATISADSIAITLLPDGRYETIFYNFTGSAGTRMIYGCDGVNKGFQFDGVTYTPIVTGMAKDQPTHVYAHKYQLFFSFAGSAQHSGPGTPLAWTPILGAAELAVGDTITGFTSEYGNDAGGALAIYSRNSIHILYGSGSKDWQLIRYRDDIGAYPYTVQQVGLTMMVDDRGITSLGQSQDFGNFLHSTLSTLIQPHIITKKALSCSSCIVRDKNQYRIFFRDKSALYITMEGRKVIGMMPVQLDHVVTCIVSQENANGSEEIHFGTDDGYVMQMESGTSMDGQVIDAYAMTHFAHFGRPRLLKRYLAASIELSGLGYCKFDFSFELGYNTTALHQPNNTTIDATFNSSRWDVFTWDSFWWDGQSISPAYSKMFGSAENVSLIVRTSSAKYKPLRFSGVNVRLRQGRYLK